MRLYSHHFVPGAGRSCAYLQGGERCGLAPGHALHLPMPEEAERPLTSDHNPEPLAGYDVTAPVVPDSVQAWDEFSRQVRSLLMRKSKGYGPAWREQGYMGNLARVLSKASRLRNLMWTDISPENEGQFDNPLEDERVQDTVLDLGGLVALLWANLRSENRWGREG